MFERRWEIRARELDSGDRLNNGLIYRFFFRFSAERECKALNRTRLSQGYFKWEFHIHDRQADV